MVEQLSVDALMPQEMAHRAEYIGIRKAELDPIVVFALAILAGAFIALGAVFATVTAAGGSALPLGVAKLLTGFTFCLGLILVVVAGAELFTGNNLIVMAWASGKVSTRALLKNWTLVYVGNFIGALITAVLMFFTKQYTFTNGAVGQTALAIANTKVNLGFIQAMALGIMCNALVCLAVWLTFSARSVIDKIAAIIFPITAFVASGFEHSVANMYFIPIALLIKTFDPKFTEGPALENLTVKGFLLSNLLPVTIGNIIGGAALVAATYWFIYLRQRD